jgi:hypothetical protein
MERCKTKFVPKFMKENTDKLNRLRKKTIKKIKSNLKKVGDDEEKKKSLETQLKFFTKFLKPNSKKSQKIANESYEQIYCNPNCLGTTFQEDADYEKLADKYCKRVHCSDKKWMVKTLKKNRKEMQNGHKTLLVNSFYRGIPKTKVAKIMKHGAISGCIEQ